MMNALKMVILWTMQCKQFFVTSEIEVLYNEFMAYVESQVKKDDIWKFWHGFVFHDCLAYVGLFFAVRGGKWVLHIASLKKLCPFLLLLIE